MKTLILFISLFTGIVINTDSRTSEDINLFTVNAIFDAYEGEMYFFTDVETEESLTLVVKDKDVIKDFRLEQGEYIGETFQLTVNKNAEIPVIENLTKI